MGKADELVRRLQFPLDEEERGEVANDLLREFHRGYPLKHLRTFLASTSDQVLRTGVWIASELGSKAHPLLQEVALLLKHKLKHIRFFAIDSVLTCASGEDGAIVAEVARLLDDSESAVRWKAIDFLARADEAQLRGALSHLQQTDMISKHTQGLQWLLSDHAKRSDLIAHALQGTERPMPFYAVAAAARISDVDNAPLKLALSLKDEDVVGFARSAIHHFSAPLR